MIKEDIISEKAKLRIFKIGSIEKIKKLKERYILPVEVRIKKLGKKKRFKIFLVDGHKIRQFIDYDFTMGGHGLRYIYIPLNEIWIDIANRMEREEIILHETTEFALMKKRLDYNRAHDIASLNELELRNRKLILPVGHQRQLNPWSCGPTALRIVLNYYKDFKKITELIKITDCNKDGTLHKGFRAALRKMGYRFSEKSNAALGDIEIFLQRAIPVIVDYQAYHGGHFAVVVGYDKNRVLVSDPASGKKYKWIPKKRFLQRWWEEDEPGVIIKRWLLAIFRK